jgi:hypothetical protein
MNQLREQLSAQREAKRAARRAAGLPDDDDADFLEEDEVLQLEKTSQSDSRART